MPFTIPKEEDQTKTPSQAPPAPKAPAAPTAPVAPTIKTPTTTTNNDWGGMSPFQLSGGGNVGVGGIGYMPQPQQAQTPAQPTKPSGPAAANGFGDQSSLVPQTANQAGTGFVNLSRVLGANVGAGEGLLSSANKKLGGAFAARQGAQNAYGQQVATAKGKSALGSTAFSAPDVLTNALMGGDVNGAVAQGLKGLDVARFGYDPNANKDMQDLRGLGNGNVAGRVLAKDAGITGGYSPKLSALDALIYGGNSAAADSVAATKGAYNNETASAKQDAAKINSDTDALRKSASDAAAAHAQTLRDIAIGRQTSAQQAADTANANRTSDIANGIMRDDHGNIIGHVNPNGPAPVWEGNSNNAVAGNFYQGGEDVQTIARLLNDPSLVMQSLGPYQSGYLRQDETNPALAPDLPTAPSAADQRAEAERMRDIAQRQGNPNYRAPATPPKKRDRDTVGVGSGGF